MNSEQFIKYFEGMASSSEKELMLHYIRQSDENLLEFEQAKEDWKRSHDKVISLNSWQSWQQIQQKINPQYSFNKKTIISIVSMAASIFLLFGVALYTLSLRSNSQLVSIHSESGQLTEVYLPDSTKVFLNSASHLVYKTNFFGLNREVALNGEAFFDVSKKKYGSFDVVADQVRVHVTGTKFNVKAYPDENISIVLEEGSVELNHESNPSFKTNMQPGDMMEFDMELNKFKRKRVNTADYTNWKNGILYFNNNKLPDLLTVLERIYGIEFSPVTDPVLKELTLTFTLRNEQLEQVIQLISNALPVEIETRNQIVNISLDKEKYKKIKK